MGKPYGVLMHVPHGILLKLFSVLVTANLTCWSIAFALFCLSFEEEIVLDYPERAIFWRIFSSVPLKALHAFEASSVA